MGTCKFSDCTHTNEPGCRILEAIENGKLSQERYNSYLKLKNEAKYNSDSEAYLKEKRDKNGQRAKLKLPYKNQNNCCRLIVCCAVRWSLTRVF